VRENQKGIAEIIFILIIVVLIGVVGYFALQNNQSKKQVSQPEGQTVVTHTHLPTCG